MQIDKPISNDKLPGGSTSYERLRAWYLAHLRKLQLTGDLSNGVTPASLIKRDREALVRLIEEGNSPSGLDQSNGARPQTQTGRPRSPKILVAILPNLLFVIALLIRGEDLIGNVVFRLLLAFSLLISSVFLYLMSRTVQQTRVKLDSVVHREQDIADFAYEAFWSMDDQLNFVAISPSFESMVGTEKFRLINKSALTLFPGDEVDRIKKHMLAVKEKQFLGKFETQIAKADGKLKDIELSAEYSSSDSVLYCVAEDISQRKEMERAKQDLMDMLGHDLRTPLSSLRFSLALLGKHDYGKLSEQGQSIVKTGESSLTRLIEMINQLLDLHKLDAQQSNLTLTSIPVSEVIQPALTAIERLAEQKNIDIVITCDDFSVHADKERLHQVLTNFLSNAIKYSAVNGEIRLAVKKLPGDWLGEFRVTDFGPGIDNKYHQKIFDRFFRIPAEEGNLQEGTGLGLSICKAIVEAHGGSIHLESEPEKGTSFFCHIPAVRDRSKQSATK